MKYYHIYGLLMGGASRQTEAQKLGERINIIVATPGRPFTKHTQFLV